jgi:tetratricopeptide (TPR) repeat protein
VALGEIGVDSVRRHLKRRGQVLKLTYEHGQEAAQVMFSLLEGEAPEATGAEAREALAFLRAQADELPREFKALLPEAGKAFLQQDDAPAGVAEATEGDGFSRMTSLTAMVTAIHEKHYDEARAMIAEHKARHPHDDELPTIEATVALADLDVEGAIRVLCEALVRNPEHFGHLFMLGNVLIQVGAYETAIRLYARAAQFGGEDERSALEEGLARLAENGVTEYVPTPRVAFVVKEGMGHFLDDLMRELVLDFEVRTFIYRSAADVDAALRWGDVCWFEWCNEPLVYASRHPLALQKKIVCRLHRYEAFTAFPMQVKWANVDKLVFVADHVRLIVEHTVPGLSDLVETEVISNGVDTERYTWKEHTPGFNLAYVGYLHLRKNPMLLLQILAKLVAIDTRYQLHIAGVYQDPLLRLYWTHAVREMGLDAHVHLDGWQEDIDAWLQDKDYILSSSIHESFGYAIAEAMTCGIKPVVHHFPFASEIWPEEVLFSTVDEAVSQITSTEYNSALYQHFIRRKYGLDEQVEGVRLLLQGLAVPAARPVTPAPGAIALEPIAPDAPDPEPDPGTAALDATALDRAESMYKVSRQMLVRSADRLVQERAKVA